jgi:hypothetical protein
MISTDQSKSSSYFSLALFVTIALSSQADGLCLPTAIIQGLHLMSPDAFSTESYGYMGCHL